MGFNNPNLAVWGNFWILSLIFARIEGEFQFELKLNNSSPAVLDSNVTFHAFLNITKVKINPSPTQYKYVWNDSTSTFAPNITYENGNKFAHISKEYNAKTMDNFKPGRYQMIVQVWRKINQSQAQWKNNEEFLASGKMEFNLTEHLNTDVTYNQSLSTVSPEGVYATNRTLNITVKLWDKFNNVSVLYDVFVNQTKSSSFIIKKQNTSGALLQLDFEHPGMTNISVLTKAHVFVSDASDLVRDRWMNNTVLLKDEVSDIQVKGDSEFDKGENISVLFICFGSPPFIFSWGLAADIIKPKSALSRYFTTNDNPASSSSHLFTDNTLLLDSNHNIISHKHNNKTQSNKHHSIYRNAREDNFSSLVISDREESVNQYTDNHHIRWRTNVHKTNSCQAEFRYVFEEVGNFTLFVRVQNDVGFRATQVILEVVQPDDKVDPIIIALCVIIAVVSFSAILFVYIKEKRNMYANLQSPKEETADHYFYFNRRDGNAFKEYRSIDDDSSCDSSNMNRTVGLSICVPISKNPRKVKAGMSVMYNTAKNWVTGAASSHGSQQSFYSQTYEEL